MTTLNSASSCYQLINTRQIVKFSIRKLSYTAMLIVGLFLSNHAFAATTLSISQLPLQQAVQTHPQVLIGITNSQSMDGTLSGDIMTGSGSLSSALSSLQNSSSPVNYTVPTGFTPPMQAASGGLAPYTVSQSGVLYDNGASRLNVAKAGITSILDNYMQNTDFGLITFNTSSISLYNTWVYYMSPQTGNFTFTNTQVAGNRYVTNPCFNFLPASSTVTSNCAQLGILYGILTLNTSQYMRIGASSDDSTINDILYAGSGLPGVFVTYNGPSPSSPYPPSFSLNNYKNGSIFLSYSSSTPNIGSFGTGPTNAGFVPFSPQVLYAQRGFGYSGAQSSTTGRVAVSMTSAGATPTTSSVATAIAAFTPFLRPETNSTSTTEIKALAGQSPIAGLLTTARTYLTGLSSSGCTPQRFVVLITDGLPTKDLSGSNWPPLGSAAATGYGVTATFNADGSLNTTNDQALIDAISRLQLLLSSNIKTFVIGLGAGVDPTVNAQAAATLTAMAVAGGTVNYYPATSVAAVVASLNSILISVQNGAMSTSAVAVNSTRLTTGIVEYQTSFISSDTTYQDWTGNIISKALNTTTGFPTGSTLWSATTLLDANASRVISTWNPTLNSGAGGGAPFRWANISASQQTQLQPFDTLGTSRLDYLRGTTSLEKRNGGTFRNRTHRLGDIINSQPMYVGSPQSAYSVTSSSYLSFAVSNINRTPMLYVGSNDGMVHGFNATTGAEVFAFVPNGVFANLYNLSAPLYNQSHLFFVDGSPNAADVQFSDGSWHTVLVGGEGAGGKSIYALDVTTPANLTSETNVSSAVLWEYTETDLGLTYSQPKIAQIGSSSTTTMNFAVFFGNGYNSTNNKAFLYAVNPQTGVLIRKIDLCAAVPSACSATSPQGLSTVAVAQSDGMQTSPITQVYAGDLQGNLWAVDVSNTNAASWTVRLLFKAVDSAGTAQPITMPPVVTLHPRYPANLGNFIMFGTGQLLQQSDLTSTQTQTIYGVWDKPGSSAVLGRSNLVTQTLTTVSAATSGLSQAILTSTANSINWTVKMGWFTDLPTGGQRLITAPELINGAFIATVNAPPSTTCGALATSVLLNLNYSTGGVFLSPQLDINNDGVINTSDQYGGGNPVGIALSGGYASAPVTVGPNQNNNMNQIINMSNGQQISIISPSNASRQSGWWQIQ